MWHQRSSLCLDRRILLSSSGNETGCDLGAVSSFLQDQHKHRSINNSTAICDVTKSPACKNLLVFVKRGRAGTPVAFDRGLVVIFLLFLFIVGVNLAGFQRLTFGQKFCCSPQTGDVSFSVRSPSKTGGNHTDLFCSSFSLARPSVPPWPGISCRVFHHAWNVVPCCAT